MEELLGRIAPGRPADIAAFDEGMKCRFCMVGGRRTYSEV